MLESVYLCMPEMTLLLPMGLGSGFYVSAPVENHQQMFSTAGWIVCFCLRTSLTISLCSCVFPVARTGPIAGWTDGPPLTAAIADSKRHANPDGGGLFSQWHDLGKGIHSPSSDQYSRAELNVVPVGAVDTFAGSLP